MKPSKGGSSKRRSNRRYRKSNYRRRRNNVYKKVNKLAKIDPSLVILNQQKPQFLTVSKTLASPNCFRISPGQSGSGWTLTFDPSGTYGNNSSTNGPASMPDWPSLTSLFDFYKVNYIKLHMFIDTTANLDTDPCQVYMRYNYEASVITPTLNGITQLPKVMRKTFTSQNPRITYIINPRELVLSSATTVAATALTTDNVSWMPVKARWTDISKPVKLYGFQFYFDNTSAAQTINFEIEYNVSFKYSK